MSVAIDQGSTVVTSTLDCDTTKVMDAYRLRDPRLCLNVITPYSHYLGTDAGSNPMDKQFVLADPTQATLTDTGVSITAHHTNFRLSVLAT